MGRNIDCLIPARTSRVGKQVVHLQPAPVAASCMIPLSSHSSLCECALLRLITHQHTHLEQLKKHQACHQVMCRFHAGVLSVGVSGTSARQYAINAPQPNLGCKNVSYFVTCARSRDCDGKYVGLMGWLQRAGYYHASQSYGAPGGHTVVMMILYVFISRTGMYSCTFTAD